MKTQKKPSMLAVLDRVSPGITEKFKAAWTNPALSAEEIGEQFGGITKMTMRSWAIGLSLHTKRHAYGYRSRGRKSTFRCGKQHHAILLLLSRPELNDAEIARLVQCHREYVGQIREWLSTNRITMQKEATP